MFERKKLNSLHLIDCNFESERKYFEENIYRFRLTADQAIKLIQINPNQPIAEVKKTVQREFRLNPILAIQFIFKV